MLVSIFNSPWYRFYWAYDAAIALERITTPVLCVNGDRDWIASAQKVFARLNATLTKAGNKDYTLVELASLNHCFQRCETGALAEYFAIKESMDLLALQTIGDWIVKTVNK